MTAEFVALTLACGVLTFATRVSGYLVLSRFQRIPPRVEAALDAVPAAVMTTLVAPALVSGGWREALALAATVALGWRLGLMATVFGGLAVIVVLRQV